MGRGGRCIQLFSGFTTRILNNYDFTWKPECYVTAVSRFVEEIDLINNLSVMKEFIIGVMLFI